jgi:hypothetical protein
LGSATVIWIFNTLDMDDPAPSRIPFMVVRTLRIWTFISPGSALWFAYQPPIPPIKIQ